MTDRLSPTLNQILANKGRLKNQPADMTNCSLLYLSLMAFFYLYRSVRLTDSTAETLRRRPVLHIFLYSNFVCRNERPLGMRPRMTSFYAHQVTPQNQIFPLSNGVVVSPGSFLVCLGL